MPHIQHKSHILSHARIYARYADHSRWRWWCCPTAIYVHLNSHKRNTKHHKLVCTLCAAPCLCDAFWINHELLNIVEAWCVSPDGDSGSASKIKIDCYIDNITRSTSEPERWWTFSSGKRSAEYITNQLCILEHINYIVLWNGEGRRWEAMNGYFLDAFEFRIERCVRACRFD